VFSMGAQQRQVIQMRARLLANEIQTAILPERLSGNLPSGCADNCLLSDCPDPNRLMLSSSLSCTPGLTAAPTMGSLYKHLPGTRQLSKGTEEKSREKFEERVVRIRRRLGSSNACKSVSASG